MLAVMGVQKKQPMLADADFIAAWNSGMLIEQISRLTYFKTGYAPGKSHVSEHAKKLGLTPRHESHSDLICWPVKPEHKGRYYKMLEAEDRRRKAARKHGGNGMTKISKTDRKYVAQLEELLHGRGARLVIGYDDEHIFGGWYITDEQPWDTDIVRRTLFDPKGSLPLP